jgi:hypothetical protein
MTILIASIPIVECKQLLAANSALGARIRNVGGGITAPAGNSYCNFLTCPPILATLEADPRRAGGIFVRPASLTGSSRGALNMDGRSAFSRGSRTSRSDPRALASQRAAGSD